MRRDILAQQNDPDWKAHFQFAHARAIAVGADPFAAEAFAAVSASLALDDQAKAERKAELAAVQKRLAAREAEQAQTNAVSVPDPADAAKRAVARINAGRGYPDQFKEDQEAKAAIEGQNKPDEPAAPSGDAGLAAKAAAKAVERINAGR